MTGDHFAGLIWESLERPRLNVHKTRQDAWRARAIKKKKKKIGQRPQVQKIAKMQKLRTILVSFNWNSNREQQQKPKETAKQYQGL
jgi:hypothetical protein